MREAKKLSKALSKALTQLKELRLPSGQMINPPEGSRLGRDRLDVGMSFFAVTDARLEESVLQPLATLAASRRLTANDVSNALGPFEDAVSPAPLRAVSLADIRQIYRTISGGRAAAVSIVKGVDAFRFGEGKPMYVDDSMLQVASQFNFLESTTPNHMPLKDYAADRTQGPQASLGCPGMLAQRNAVFKHAGDQPFFEAFPAYVYRGGYFMPSKFLDQELQAAFARLSEHSGEFKVLAQSGRTLFGTETIQVFTAAPSFQGEATPGMSTAEGILCDGIVSLQYEALGKLAALRSEAIGRHVRLHVTLVGQGAFKNPPEAMRSSFRSLLGSLRGYDVAVYVHAWSPADVDKAQAALREAGLDVGGISVIDANIFYRQQEAESPRLHRHPQ